jgi:leader peptidase (prepilin peptidase) / N-methyltransferase
MALLTIPLLTVFLAGMCLGSLINWAIYTLAWNPRPITPWGVLPEGARRRTWSDRVPVVGWFALKRETSIHGPRFWWRPMMLEIGCGITLAALYWWEVNRLGLIRSQLIGVVQPPTWPIHWQFISHGVLFCWMMAASFIDIDEKIIPDEITVTGTLLGLLFATLVPISMLPQIVERGGPPGPGGPPSIPMLLTNGAPALGMIGPQWLEPVTAVAPRNWPASWGAPRTLPALVIGLACYWLWCFALAPRIWRGRRGTLFAMRLIAARVAREFARPPLLWMLIAGSAFIFGVWAFGEQSWAGLMTALIGLVGSGGIVWAVRLVGTAALRREALGFGDVTLMMMVGTFLGWQACLIAFFLAPPAGIVIGIAQFVTRRDDVIPYGPFLCLGSAATVVFWGPIWMWAQPLFEVGPLVPAVLTVCLLLMGFMLGIWRLIKLFLFGEGGPEA